MNNPLKTKFLALIITIMTITACKTEISELIQKAEQGDAAAQLEYGRLLKTTGNGVDQDWGKAISMLQKAAENGNPDAQWEMGLMYEFSDKVQKDEAKALSLYRKSAEGGSAIGLYMVAHCYQHGIAVEEDTTTSDSLYAKAYAELLQLAPEEDIYVLNFLGSAYFWGDGITADREKAFHYYLISAQKGNPETQYKIGNCYETGEGTDKDMNEALQWYHKSAGQGYPDALAALERLGK